MYTYERARVSTSAPQGGREYIYILVSLYGRARVKLIDFVFYSSALSRSSLNHSSPIWGGLKSYYILLIVELKLSF